MWNEDRLHCAAGWVLSEEMEAVYTGKVEKNTSTSLDENEGGSNDQDIEQGEAFT